MSKTSSYQGNQYVCERCWVLSPGSESGLITHDSQLKRKKGGKKQQLEYYVFIQCKGESECAGNISHRRDPIDESARGIHTVLEDYLCSSEIIRSN